MGRFCMTPFKKKKEAETLEHDTCRANRPTSVSRRPSPRAAYAVQSLLRQVDQTVAAEALRHAHAPARQLQRHQLHARKLRRLRPQAVCVSGKGQPPNWELCNASANSEEVFVGLENPSWFNQIVEVQRSVANQIMKAQVPETFSERQVTGNRICQFSRAGEGRG